MLIAAAQCDCTPGDLVANAATATRLIEASAREGAQAIVLPELVDVGYVMPIGSDVVRPWAENPFLAAVSEAAAACRITVVAGIGERVGDAIYNSVVVTDGPGSVVASYRKIHLFVAAHEPTVLTPGDALCRFNLGSIEVGLSICFDLRYPTMYRRMALDGAELFVVSSAFPLPRLRVWETLLRARAIENQCFVVAANRIGTDGDLTFGGSSMIVDPFGVTIGALDEVSAGILVRHVTSERVQQVREAIPVLPFERTDVYGDVAPAFSELTLQNRSR